MKKPYVYIISNRRNGTLYTGVTSNLPKRIWQHREGIIEGFSSRYDLKMLVWFELHTNMEAAILREKVIKKWNRQWKVRLIEQHNADWRDLWADICR